MNDREPDPWMGATFLVFLTVAAIALVSLLLTS